MTHHHRTGLLAHIPSTIRFLRLIGSLALVTATITTFIFCVWYAARHFT